MKKRILSLFIALSICLSFTACSKKSKYPLAFDGVNITNGVLSYYIDKILASPKSYGVNAKDKDAVTEKAILLCADLVSADRLMKKNKTDLQTQYKTEVAEKTEDMWSLFGAYYESIGVTKPDITKINTFEAQKKQLVQYYFGMNGLRPVSEDKLKQKFVEMYIGFKGFEGSFTKENAKGETVEMTEREKEKLVAEFRKMAEKVNNGASIDDVYAEYCTKQGLVATSELQVNLFKEKDPMYADDFFKKASTISHGRAAPVISGSSVYVLLRETIATSDEDAFEAYREEVLDEMKMPSVEGKITLEAKKFNTERQADKISDCFKTVEKVRNEKAK